jgi:ATP-dependent protease ClpP protease subunit
MSKRTNLDPEEAKKYGFVHEIKNDLVPDNVTILQVD